MRYSRRNLEGDGRAFYENRRDGHDYYDHEEHYYAPENRAPQEEQHWHDERNIFERAGDAIKNTWNHWHGEGDPHRNQTNERGHHYNHPDNELYYHAEQRIREAWDQRRSRQDKENQRDYHPDYHRRSEYHRPLRNYEGRYGEDRFGSDYYHRGNFEDRGQYSRFNQEGSYGRGSAMNYRNTMYDGPHHGYERGYDYPDYYRHEGTGYSGHSNYGGPGYYSGNDYDDMGHYHHQRNYRY